MKRIVLRLTVAVVAFGLGVAVDRLVTSRVPSRAQANNEVPMIAGTIVSTNETKAGDELSCDTSGYFPLPPDAPHPILLFDFNLARFDPNGSYFPLQPLAKEFDEVKWFDLTVDQEEGEVWGGAYIQTQINNVTAFPHAQFLLITERRVFFVTSAREDTGFAYRFEGEFLSNPASQMDKGRAVVRGTLSKTKNGRTVAECEASFEVEYLGC